MNRYFQITFIYDDCHSLDNRLYSLLMVTCKVSPRMVCDWEHNYIDINLLYCQHLYYFSFTFELKKPVATALHIKYNL